ncbi:hypothetical protein [Nocardia sp. NPDC049149]|uniref:hypothetical protein n=1 Tax=Nocardia sp. NPDC049149 TaxID=3364315 RepID=UPI00371F3CBF
MTDYPPDEELRRIINDEYACFDRWHRRLATELLKLRTTQRPPLPPELDDEAVLELARIAWDAENVTGEVPAGAGYDWADLGVNGHKAAADGVRAVLAELGRRGYLRDSRPPLGYTVACVWSDAEVTVARASCTSRADAEEFRESLQSQAEYLPGTPPRGGYVVARVCAERGIGDKADEVQP